MPEIKRAEPAYMQIARHYREKIEAGKMQPGEVFPSIPDVAKEWNTSRQTAHNAMKELQRSGHILSEVGARTVVTVPPEQH